MPVEVVAALVDVVLGVVEAELGVVEGLLEALWPALLELGGLDDVDVVEPFDDAAT